MCPYVTRGIPTEALLLPCHCCTPCHSCFSCVCQVRDPVAGVFSAETMLRGMGVALPWSLADPLAAAAPDSLEAAEAGLTEGADTRFKVSSPVRHGATGAIVSHARGTFRMGQADSSNQEGLCPIGQTSGDTRPVFLTPCQVCLRLLRLPL
jgi:hypothetical protein